jgi:hypothetical protein
MEKNLEKANGLTAAYHHNSRSNIHYNSSRHIHHDITVKQHEHEDFWTAHDSSIAAARFQHCKHRVIIMSHHQIKLNSHVETTNVTQP